MQFLGNVLVDGFVHRAFPINRGEQMDEVNAQGGGDDQHVKIGDTDGAGLDLGKGATGGVVPAGELQFDGKILLRPAITLAQFDDLPSNQVQFLHGNRVSISCNSICVVHPMDKMKLLFLPQTRRAGCNEIVTTFAPASARFSRFVFSKKRSEFCFTMKQNFPCQLRRSRAGSKQPMNARNGRCRVTPVLRLKVGLSIFVSLFLAQTRH